MNKLLKGLPYIIIAGLLLFIFINRWADYNPQTTKTVEIDSTSTLTTDSTHIGWEWIFPDSSEVPDTVYKKIEVAPPTDIQKTDSVATRMYNQSYQDSLIHAQWTTKVAGQLLSQEFQYIPQPLRFRQKTVTKWRTNTVTITKTVTIREKPSGYMTGGLIAGGWEDRFALGPSVGFTSSRGDHISVGYDAINRGVMITGEIKLSFKSILPF